MDIQEYTNNLNNFIGSKDFAAMNPQQQQESIAGARNWYLQENPDASAETIDSITQGTNVSYLRNTGQGRALPIININLPSQDPKFNDLKKEDQLQKIEEYKLKIPEIAASVPTQKEDAEYFINQSVRQLERQVNGQQTGYIADKGKRLVEGFAAGLASGIGADSAAEGIQDFFHENTKYDEDFTAQLAQGLGSAGSSVLIIAGSAALAGGLGATAATAEAIGIGSSLASNGIMRYNDGYKNAIAKGLNADQAHEMGVSAMPAAVIDALSDHIIASKLMPARVNKVFATGSDAAKKAMFAEITADVALRGKMVNWAQSAITEGLSEAVGDYAAAYGPYLLSGDRSYLPSDKESLNSFAIGAIIGGGLSSVSDIPNLIGNKEGAKQTVTNPDGTTSEVTPKYSSKAERDVAETQRTVAQLDPNHSSQVFSLLSEGRYKEARQLSDKYLQESLQPPAPPAAAPTINPTKPAQTPQPPDTTAEDAEAERLKAEIAQKEAAANADPNAVDLASSEQLQAAKDQLAEIDKRRQARAAEAQKVNAAETPAFTLAGVPGILSPRYGFGSNLSELDFESDLDKAAYIVSKDPKKAPAKSAPQIYAAAAQAGITPEQLVAHGKKVREDIKNRTPALNGTRIAIAVPTISFEPNVKPQTEASKKAAAAAANSVDNVKRAFGHPVDEPEATEATDATAAPIINVTEGGLATPSNEPAAAPVQGLQKVEPRPPVPTFSENFTPEESAEYDAGLVALNEWQINYGQTHDAVTGEPLATTPSQAVTEVAGQEVNTSGIPAPVAAPAVAPVVKPGKSTPDAFFKAVRHIVPPDKVAAFQEMLQDIKMKNPRLRFTMDRGDYPIDAAGLYDGGENLVYISPNHLDYRTVAHEVTHSLTQADIRRWVSGRPEATHKLQLAAALADPATPAHIKTLIDVYQVAAKKLGQESVVGIEQKAENLILFKTMTGEAYAMTTLDEFVAGAMTLQSFQEQLANIPYKGSSLWEHIVDTLRNGLAWMRGVASQDLLARSDGENALVATLAATREIIDTRTAPGKGNVNYLFGGEKAQTSQFMSDALDNARGMSSAGASPEFIRSFTGWFVSPYDGKLRWEIPDANSKTTEAFDALPNSGAMDNNPESILLSDAIDHPELFEAYPQLKDIRVTKQSAFMDFFGGTQGWFNPKTNTLNITPNARNPLSTMLHEIQHGIQGIEGFAQGGNLSTAVDKLSPEQKASAVEKMKAKSDELIESANKKLQSSKDLIEFTKTINPDEFNQAANSVEEASKRFLELARIHDDASNPERMRSYEEYTNAQDALLMVAGINPRDQLKNWDVAYAVKNAKSFSDLQEEAKKKETQATESILNYTSVITNAGNSDEGFKKAVNTFNLAHELYTRISGEIESRDVQARMDMTPEQRAATAPYSSENIAPEDAITLFHPDSEKSNINYLPENQRQEDFAKELQKRVQQKMDESLKTDLQVGDDVWTITGGRGKFVSHLTSKDGVARISVKFPTGETSGVSMDRILLHVPDREDVLMGIAKVYSESRAGGQKEAFMESAARKGYDVDEAEAAWGINKMESQESNINYLPSNPLEGHPDLGVGIGGGSQDGSFEQKVLNDSQRMQRGYPEIYATIQSSLPKNLQPIAQYATGIRSSTYEHIGDLAHRAGSEHLGSIPDKIERHSSGYNIMSGRLQQEIANQDRENVTHAIQQRAKKEGKEISLRDAELSAAFEPELSKAKQYNKLLDATYAALYSRLQSFTPLQAAGRNMAIAFGMQRYALYQNIGEKIKAFFDAAKKSGIKPEELYKLGFDENGVGNLSRTNNELSQQWENNKKILENGINAGPASTVAENMQSQLQDQISHSDLEAPLDALASLTNQMNQGITNPEVNINYLPAQTRAQQLTNGYRRFDAITKGNITDKIDTPTQRIIGLLKDIKPSDIHVLPNNLQDYFFELVNNIYESRKGVANPQIRIDSEEMAQRITAVKIAVDSNRINDMIQKFDSVIDFDGLNIDLDNRRAVEEAVNDYMEKEQVADVQKRQNQSAAAKARTQQIYQQFRDLCGDLRKGITARFVDKDNYIKEIESIYGQKLDNFPSLKEFLGFHYDYAMTADVNALESKKLYQHSFALQNILDGNFRGMDLTAEHIGKLRDVQDDIKSLTTQFRDPVTERSRMWRALDQVNKLAELHQTKLQRITGYETARRFLQEKLLGGFYDGIIRVANNQKLSFTDEYIAFRDKLLGRESTAEDKIVCAIMGRLPQRQVGEDPDAALLRNIKKERESIQNKINNATTTDARKQYRMTISPLFEGIVKGLEEYGEGSMIHFMDTFDARAQGTQDEKTGQQRRQLVEKTQEIFARYTLASRILSEGLLGKTFNQQIAYIPNDVRRAFEGGDPEPRELDDTSRPEDHSRDKGLTAEQAHYKERQTSLGEDGYYSYNNEHTLKRNVEKLSVDHATLVERSIIKARLKKGGELNKIITQSKDNEFHEQRVDYIKSLVMQVVDNATSSGTPQNAIVQVLSKATKIYAQGALSGIHHVVSQNVSAITDYGIRTGNATGWLQAASFYASNFDKVNKWLNENQRWTGDRSATETLGLDASRTPVEEEGILNHPVVKWLNKFHEGAGHIITTSLRLGDNFSSKVTILAEYQRLRKEKGYSFANVGDIDFTVTEGQLLTQATLNAERIINTSNKTLRSDLFSDRNMSTTIVRNLLFAFASHGSNLATQVNLAIRDLVELKGTNAPAGEIASKVRTIGAILAQGIMFNSARFAVAALAGKLIISLVQELFDDDDGKIEELETKVQIARKRSNGSEKAKIKINEAETELANAKSVRSLMAKLSNQSSMQSWFNSSIREASGSAWMGFNSQGIQNIILYVPDEIMKGIAGEGQKQVEADLAGQIKVAREKKDLKKVARLTEQATMINAIEYVPLTYSNTQGFGLPGVYGSITDAAKIHVAEAFGAYQGTKDWNYTDFLSAAATAGLLPADVNKALKEIDKVEDAMVKRGVTAEAQQAKIHEEAKKPKKSGINFAGFR